MALFYTYSGNVYGTGSAGQTTFALTSSAGNPIPYLLPAHIHVSTSINDQQTWVELARPADWDFDAQGTSVVLTNPLPVATELRVQRITPTEEPFVDFQASSLLTAEQLNEGEEFSLYVDQELRDAVDIDFSGALIYKGTVDLTADNAPLNPVNGWTLYNTGAGTVIQGGTPGWDGIVGATVEGGEQVIFDGAQWEIAPQPPDGVVLVNSSAPITVDGTDPQRPVIGITDATTSAAGAMSAADKTKLDGIETGAQVNVATDLGYTAAASTGVVSSSTGTDATIPAATTTEAGLLTGADKTKLDGIQTGAQANVWERTGTILSPVNAGDDISTLGDISTVGRVGAEGLTVGAITFPNVDGTSGQVLVTDGAGAVSWGPGVITSSTAPANPSNGQLWVDTNEDPPVLKIWDATPGPGEWVVASGGASVEIGSTPPATPTAGDMWWNNDDGRLYIYYTDADSSQWVDASPDSAAPPDLWSRTGTTLSPATAGDSISVADAQVTSLNGGQLAGFRNQLINGNFHVNQRGGGPFGSGSQYTTDRWKASSADRVTVSNTGPLNSNSLVTTGAAMSIAQGVELVPEPGRSGPFVQGSVWTVSAWATAAINLSVAFLDGVIDATNAVTVKADALMTATSETDNGFTKYVATFTVGVSPNPTNKLLQIGFNNVTGSIAMAQLEPGPVATPFEYRPYGTELALCQRYFEVGDLFVRRGSSESGQGQFELIRFCVIKRIAPTIVAGGATSSVNVTSDSFANIRDNFFNWNVTPTNPGGYSLLDRIFQATAEL